MDMHDRSTRFRRAETRIGDLLGRDRQIRRHVRRRLVARDGTGDDDFIAWNDHVELPSTYLCVRRVYDAPRSIVRRLTRSSIILSIVSFLLAAASSEKRIGVLRRLSTARAAIQKLSATSNQ
jgi:hypothetical protein